MPKLFSRSAILLFLLLLSSGLLSAQGSQNLEKGLALKGYDAVAYFSGKALKGSSSHAIKYNHATYFFSSAQNLNTFKANPKSYVPQYGGYCAYALALDKGKVDINPKKFKIVKGKLYLFYSSKLWGDTLKKWNNSPDAPQIKIADRIWKKTT